LWIQIPEDDVLSSASQLAAEIPGRRRLADTTLAMSDADAEVSPLRLAY
jgi:hypothetical protein